MSRFSSSRVGSLAAFTTLSAAVLVLAGCSRPVGSVTGTVTHQGKNLKGGSVSFISTDDGRSFAAGIKEDGTYTIPDLQGGSYKVCVETSSLKPQTGAAMSGFNTQPIIPKGAKTGPPPGAAVPEGYSPSDPAAAAAANSAKRYVKISDHYADPSKTDLTYEFKGGSETFNIDLK